MDRRDDLREAEDAPDRLPLFLFRRAGLDIAAEPLELSSDDAVDRCRPALEPIGMEAGDGVISGPEKRLIAAVSTPNGKRILA